MVRKDDIKKLIIIEKKNTFLSHLQHSILFDFNKYYGEIEKDQISLWFSTFWMRFNYPIFILKFNSQNYLTGIKIEKNSFNKFYEILILTSVIIIASSSFFILNLRTGIFISISLLIFSLIFYFALKKYSNSERQSLVLELKKKIREIEQKNKPKNFSLQTIEYSKPYEKEKWNFSKFLLRLILYPFSICIIYFSAKIFFPLNQILYGLLGIGVGLSYIISDIIILLKKTTANNVYKK